MNKYEKIIFTLYSILGILSLATPFLIKQNNTQADYGFIVSSLRFFLANNNENILEIATHNWAIVALAFISNFYTFGLAGCIIVPISFFVISTITSINPSFPVIVFTVLESTSILLSVIYSLYIVQKRKRDKISFKNMYIHSLKILSLIYLILLVAASIEIQVLPKFNKL